MPKVIKFYRRNEPYGEFSCFHTSPMVINGLSYQTVEHYYQSKRFNNNKESERIRNTLSPHSAKLMAHTSISPYIKDWYNKRNEIMLTALRAKFQIPKFKAILLATEDAILIEDSPNEYWGIGKGNGQNMLGKLLMQVRKELLEYEQNKMS